MCTYLNDKLIAYTGQVPAHLAISDDGIKMGATSTRNPPAHIAKDDDMIAVNASFTSGERESFSLPDEDTEVIKRYTRRRGGSYRNCGKKPKYKDPRCIGHFRAKHTRHNVTGMLIAI